MTLKEKQEVLFCFYKSLAIAWTYKKLTNEEKEKLIDVFEWVRNCGTLEEMNTIKQIQALGNATYRTFLECIGYSGYNWRDDK